MAGMIVAAVRKWGHDFLKGPVQQLSDHLQEFHPPCCIDQDRLQGSMEKHFTGHMVQEDRLVLLNHDFGIILQEWAILPGSSVPNTANMEFNWLTFNGVASPMTTPMLVRLGSRVRIRMLNLGMAHHPIHLHGHTFAVTRTERAR